MIFSLFVSLSALLMSLLFRVMHCFVIVKFIIIYVQCTEAVEPLLK